MKRAWKPVGLVLLISLCVSLGGCSAAESAIPPEFWRTASVQVGETAGKLTEQTFTVESPETLAGMELSVSGGIVSVTFGGITKTSDTTAGLRDLEAARLLLCLEELSGAQMNLQAVTEGRASYTASASQGEYIVTAEADGRVTEIKNETTGLAATFTPEETAGGEE